MSYTRRTILKGSAVAIASAMTARPAMALLNEAWEPVPPIQDPRLRQLMQTAIDAAMGAGASYADARLVFTRTLTYGQESPIRTETMGFGVRTLMQGYWGFASSPVWNTTEAARLGQDAVAQAKANTLGRPRETALAPMRESMSGDWVMPVKNDPFEMAYEEIWDFMAGLDAFVGRLKGLQGKKLECDFHCQDKAFGSSLGQFTTQRLYRTQGVVSFSVHNATGRRSSASLDCLTPAGLGFEYLRDQPLRQYITEVYEEAMKDLELPMLPIDVGRYTILLDPLGTASVLSQTIGAASEVDRAMGYEANASGTSYIVDPLGMLGSLKVGNTQVTVIADRSGLGSVGRVKWDDEGVEPVTSTLIKDGVLVNMQTNREGASWIAPHFTRTNQRLESSGCAYAPDAIEAPLTHSADLTLQPGTNDSATLDSIRGEITDGIELKAPNISLDFQQITGLGRGKAYQIKNGKRTALLSDVGVIFRTSELWSNVSARGGQSSARRYGLQEQKGEPAQLSYHSVTAPPIICEDMTCIDIKRKA